MNGTEEAQKSVEVFDGADKRVSLFLPCARHIESVVAAEALSIGCSSVKETTAGVACEAKLSDAYRLCLWSRTASRVLLLLAEGEARNEEELYRFAASSAWSRHFASRSTFAVTASSSKSSIKNANYAVLKIKDGIVDSFREEGRERPSVDTRYPDIRFYGRIEGDRVKLYLDCSGEGLHKRGYRIEKTEAPLRETAAAAMLLKANWPDIYEKGGSFLDPMCGSGTLAIEAALIAADTAPGLLRRRFGFHSWRGHRDDLWNSLLEEARDRDGRKAIEPNGFFPRIYASDEDARAVEICRGNMRRAGLENRIELEQSDFRRLSPQALEGTGEYMQTDGGHSRTPRGLVAVNPPYGIRLEEEAAVKKLYEELGRWLATASPGLRAAVLCAGKEEAKYIGLRASRLSYFYNGSIEAALAIFEIDGKNEFRPYRPQKSEEVQRGGDVTSGIESIINRFRKNYRNLKKYLKKHEISSFRLYDADIPQYAAALDVYEGRYAVIQEYAPPKSVDSDRAAIRLREIISASCEYLEIPEEQVFLKQRRRRRGGEQYEKYSEGGEFYVVHEGGLRFFVNFTDYLDTGLFLDHRIVRDLVRRRASGRRVLNLFAYTCTASVYAADGGARETVSVDTSATYLEWGKKNFGLNRIDMGTHSFIRCDALEYLRGCGEEFGLIFIDPPTFSNRKDAAHDFDVQRDHEELIEAAGRLLSADGLILFSNNYRSFEPARGLRELWSIKDISQESIPRDFERNKKIHHSFLLSK